MYDCHSSSKPSWRPFSLTRSPMLMCLSGTGDCWAMSWAWVVLPVPGVPVISIVGNCLPSCESGSIVQSGMWMWIYAEFMFLFALGNLSSSICQIRKFALPPFWSKYITWLVPSHWSTYERTESSAVAKATESSSFAGPRFHPRWVCTYSLVD